MHDMKVMRIRQWRLCLTRSIDSFLVRACVDQCRGSGEQWNTAMEALRSKGKKKAEVAW